MFRQAAALDVNTSPPAAWYRDKIASETIAMVLAVAGGTGRDLGVVFQMVSGADREGLRVGRRRSRFWAMAVVDRVRPAPGGKGSPHRAISALTVKGIPTGGATPRTHTDECAKACGVARERPRCPLR